MKYLSLLLITSFLLSPLYAKTINLDINNFSRDKITIVKSNGEEINLEPLQDKNQIPFEIPSVIKNYIDGEYVCSWNIKNEKVFAIAYGVPTNGFCAVMTY